NTGGRHEDLEGDAASRNSRAWQQRLTDDAFEHQRELRANLRLLMRREHVDDTVDGRGRRVGVQGRKSQVAGFGDAQRRLDGLHVAHFADEHDIRVFTKRGAQGGGETLRVVVNLALIDQPLLVYVQIFDGVFNRQDVIVP